jgi:hypothetical protein
MPTKSTDGTLSLDQLHERFPRSAERFRASKYWRPFQEDDIVADLVTFLDMQDFVIINAMVFDKDTPDTDGLIGYEPVVKIKGQNVDIGGQWFPGFDEARLHALDYVLDIFEEEQKITA